MRANKRLLAVVLVAAVVGSVVGAGATSLLGGGTGTAGDVSPTTRPDVSTNATDDPELKQFESREAFERYARQSASSGGVYAFGGGAGGAGGDAGGPTVARGTPMTEPTVETDVARRAPKNGGQGSNSDSPRYSNTNVQEKGIQEPDVLKSDGTTIYFANRPGRAYYAEKHSAGRTRIVDASTPADPALVGNVSKSGRMFLTGDTLVVISNRAIYGYDVSDRDDPKQKWKHSLNGSVAAARTIDGEMYLVVRQGVTVERPCPVEPLSGGPSIDCTDVYHPVGEASAEVTYTTMRMNPESGTVEDSVSVVGSRQHSATYVSENAVYLTYTRDASRMETLTTYLLEEKRSLLGEVTASRLERVRKLNISDRARQVETQVILRQWLQSMSEKRRQMVMETLQTGFQKYLEEHKRELSTTGIVKVGIQGDLSIEASGEVPGHPLNQFSMDESNGTLRIATTVSGFGTESENDLYTLDSDLDRQGSVQGMAPGQRIYSVRYVGDTAYVVTFRQVDPFHVIDLSNPDDPKELGQVKLPGFSRYLHPLGNDTILGIGEEDGQVKATLFDVSTPSNPKVMDSKVIDDSWSAISDSHHAFLLDRKHGVFFLPGSEGGYVFGYEGGLTLEKRVDTAGPARRAMYLENYMYVFARGGLTVVDETDWSTVETVEFGGYERPDPDPQRPPDVDIRYEFENGTLQLVHQGGEVLEGDNLAFQCDDSTVEIEDGSYSDDDTILRTDECDPGEDAELIWRGPDGELVDTLADFRVPDGE